MRKFLGAIALVAILSTPATALESYHGQGGAEDEVPVVFDAFLMRPLGLITTALGCTFWAASTPILAITRPTDMHKTFKSLVINPARFTFVDPLGTHPDRSRADERGEIL
jgi:hypothetical protein